MPSPTRRRAVVVLLLLAAAVLGGWWLRSRAVDPLRRVDRLAPARRTFEVRTVGLGHRPRHRDRGPAQEEGSWRLLAEVGELTDRLGDDATDADLHALGLAHLVLGDPGSAVSALEHVAEASADLGIAADLAASRIEWGLATDRPDRVAEGLEAVETLLDPGRAQGASEEVRAVLHFDRALGLEGLGLRREARDAWNEAVETDPSSPWAEEAREASSRLEARVELDRPGPAELERRVLEEALPEALEAMQETAETGEALAAVRTLARDHAAATGEDLLPAIVGHLEELSPPTRATVVEGLQRIESARRAVGEDDLEGCLRSARQAATLLRNAGSPAAPLATLRLASCHFLRNELDDAAAILDPLRRSLGSGSPSLAGRAAWILGLTEHARNRPARALDLYQEALVHFRSIGDATREAAVQGLLADLFGYLGRRLDAWKAITDALRRSTGTQRSYQLRASLARLALQAERPRVALTVTETLVEEARSLRRATFMSDSSLLRARALSALGAAREATTILQEALTLLTELPDEAGRIRSAHHVRVALAESLVDSRPDRAGSLAGQVLAAGPPGDLYLPASRVRASTLRSQGKPAAAEAVLRQALERSENERRRLGSRPESDALFEARRGVFEDLVRALVDDGRPIEALRILEAQRADPRAPAGRPGSTRAESDEDVHPWSPESRAVVFLPLPEELLVWNLADGEVRLGRRRITRGRLEELVDSSIDEVMKSGHGPCTLELTGLLFPEGPPASTELVVVPGALLSAVPFSALPSTSDEGPLFESRRISISPSLAVWRGNLAQAPSANRCALVARGSRDGGRLIPALARLDLLAEETATVRDLYECGRVVDSGTAFQTELGTDRGGFVHFAGHSLADAGLLMDDDSRVELIAPEQIAGIRGAPGRTVVLGSCSGADGRPSHAVGRDSLALAFLAAGARTVIANLWPIADTEARRFAEALHSRLARGESPAAALRETQIELRAAGLAPTAWAGWTLLGAGS